MPLIFGDSMMTRSRCLPLRDIFENSIWKVETNTGSGEDIKQIRETLDYYNENLLGFQHSNQ
jgi:hypothetical protein